MQTQAEQQREAYLRRKLRRQMSVVMGERKQFSALNRMLENAHTNEMLEQWRTELGDRTLSKLQRIATDMHELDALWEKRNAA